MQNDCLFNAAKSHIVSAEAKIEKYFQRDCSLLFDRVVFTDAIVVIGNTS